MKKSLMAAFLAGAVLSPVAAMAQDAPATAAAQVVAGAKVYGPQGKEEVGTIEKVEGGNAVVNTGTVRATLPANVFGTSPAGLIISMSKAQLEAAVGAAEAKASASTTAALVPDAQVKSKDGVLVGSVQKIEGENVTLDLTGGNAITLKKDFLMADASGGLMLAMTAADFQAAVSSATQAASSTQASADAQAGASTDAAASTTPEE